ncbi:MAG: 23S rRNA (uracil(1939)-C(5))-methyltransferase RlmD [Lachnospiraceae bacterium]|nr:23S rRNA (uracil(1939)-C(5))-methyltransferase RlmD [Lachnospiraceae bacterium]
MKKGELHQGKVIRMDFPNKGIVEVITKEDEMSKELSDKARVTVKNALPGQTVSFVINKKKNGLAEGRLLEVLAPAEWETEDRCPHAGICGGCLYQGFPYEKQLEIKEKQVLRLLEKYMGDAEYDGIKASPKAIEYRNKMEFSFGDEYKDGPVTLGLHKRGSMYDIVPVTDCRIMDEDYRRILCFTKDYFAKCGYPFFHKLRHEGYLRHLLVRKAVKTGEILIALVTTTQETHDLGEYAEGLLQLNLDGVITGILHIENDSLADVVKCDKQNLLYGKDWFEEELLGLKFKISPFSFFQTNSLGAEVLYDTVRQYLKGEEAGGTVFDLYSGTGTIAQMLAPAAKQVIGVEIVEEAVEAAKENAALNGLSDCDFLAGDVLKVLDDITEKPDTIILDPPRDGVHPKALKKIIDYGVKHMVYISCKPTSLARDLEMLTGRGYEVKKVCMVDMFPNSGNIETVVLLSQQKADDYIELELELDELDLTTAESKATYAEIKDYVLKVHGLKVSSLYISQVKRKCGIEVGENYNLPKSEDSRQPQCPEEKEKAIKNALEHFGMV